jgi:hypothetical protein
MIDVNKITSTLAKLPDQQLQQYAQMHKNDPYIMALAMSESNRRKELRAAGQGAAQEQPKVVDQMVAQMAPQQLPEDMGIGQLPAGEMNFAGGGIVAFADGGDVERYQSQGLVQDPRLTSLLAARERYLRSNADTSAIDQAIAALQAKSAQGPAPTAAPLNLPTGGDFAEQMVQGVTAPTFAPAPSFTPAVNRSMLNRVEQPARTNAAVYGAPAKAEDKIVDKGRGKDKTDRGASTDTAGAKKETGFDALLRSLDGAAAPAATDSGFSQKITDLTNARVQARREEAEGLDAIHKQFSDIFKGREERLSKREGELGKMKDQSMGLALLQAGAAIMSTPGSLGTAIGRGVDVGSKQYAAGMEKLNAAKDKLSDARDRLDDLNAQRGEMTAREKLKAMSAIKTEEAAGLELLLKADMDMHKISREEALKRLDLRTRIGIAQLQEQGQNARAVAGNRNNQLEVLRAVEADPRLMAAYRAMQGKNEDIMGQYNDFLKANPTLAMDPQKAMTQFLMSKSVFSQLGATPVTEKATGPIRKQP